MNNFITINGRKIGNSYSPYIIAEMSANHNGDINNAYKIIDMAKASGANAVKLQTYTPDTLTIDSDFPDFQYQAHLVTPPVPYCPGTPVKHCSKKTSLYP